MTVDDSDITAEELLNTAHELLSSPAPTTRGLWPRTTAFLIRLALEQTLDEMWQRTQPGLVGCSMRAQLLCLPTYVGEAFAQRASAAWAGLSRACHYHTYELSPAASELRHWHDEVVLMRNQA